MLTFNIIFQKNLKFCVFDRKLKFLCCYSYLMHMCWIKKKYYNLYTMEDFLES